MGAAGPVLSVPTPVLQVAVLVLLLALFGAWPAVLLWLALQPLLALLHLRALVSRPDPAFSKLELWTAPMLPAAECARWALDMLNEPYTEKRQAGWLPLVGQPLPVLTNDAATVYGLQHILALVAGLRGGAAQALVQPSQSGSPTSDPDVVAADLTRLQELALPFVYGEVLAHSDQAQARQVLLRLWGGQEAAVPGRQRLLARLALPLLSGICRLRLGLATHDHAALGTRKANIRALLQSMQTRLQLTREPTQRRPYLDPSAGFTSHDLRLAVLVAWFGCMPDFSNGADVHAQMDPELPSSTVSGIRNFAREVREMPIYGWACMMYKKHRGPSK